MTVLVRGESMVPALCPGDRLIVRLGGHVRAGNIVVARHPGGAELIVKRAFRRTPEGWWLESDNQGARGRRDSWDFGAVPDRDITGRVVGRYWPPARLSLAQSTFERKF
jgi:nickel-type superoxide dismutase maturation protease